MPVIVSGDYDIGNCYIRLDQLWINCSLIEEIHSKWIVFFLSINCHDRHNYNDVNNMKRIWLNYNLFYLNCKYIYQITSES